MKTYKDIDGWFNFEDLYSKMIEEYKDKTDITFVEIGTWMGKSIIYLADLIKKNKSDIKLYGIDNFVGTINNTLGDIVKNKYNGNFLNQYLKNIEDCGVSDYITTLNMPSLDAVNKFEDHSIDFIFIDGDHSYIAVKNDLNVWYKKVKKNGYICGHDLPNNGVRRALSEFTKQNNLKFKQVSKSSWMIINK